MNTAFWFLILLACPLMMMFMMRGMHDGGHGEQPTEPGSAPGGRVLDKDRLADLEREVAELRATRDRSAGAGR